jgi:TPR repeat protein
MNIKSNLISTLIISLLLFVQTAHADFRKAIDLYIARDGKAMLNEVQTAVAKKDNDGLILFLKAMGDDASASNYNFDTHETDSTLREILTKPQWDKLRGLLVQASEKCTIEVQYDLRTSSQFSSDFFREYLNKQPDKNRSSGDAIRIVAPLTNSQYFEAKQKIMIEYIQHGSKHAMLQSDNIFVRANGGDPLSQLQLGLKHLNAKSDEGCGRSPEDPLCKTRDETKGYSWLKRAVKSYELSPSGDIDVLSYEMCQVLRENAKGNQETIRQAYLWALFGMDYTIQKSFFCLDQMHKAGELKQVDPALDKVFEKRWDDSEKLNLLYQAKTLPSWIMDVRNEINPHELPVFTSYPGLATTVFEDGRVMDVNQEVVLMRVSPDTVKAFMTELKNMGFWDWNFRGLAFDMCMHGECEGNKTSVRVMSRSLKKTKHLLLESIYLDPKSIIAQRMANLILLREKYFPYITNSCSFAKSELYKQACKKPPLKEWYKILKEQ